MHNLVAFCVGGILLLCGTCGAAAEKEKSEQAGPHVVARTEQKVAVVFTVRIVRNGQKPLQNAEIRIRLPVAMPHQDIDALRVEGKPQRRLDRWQEPVLIYRQSELSSGQIMTGRWSAECRIRQLQWNLKRTVPVFVPTKMGLSPSTPRENPAAALSVEEKALYLRDARRETGGRRWFSPEDVGLAEIDPAKTTSVPFAPCERLPVEEKALYLRDARNFALSDPAVKAAAREATAGRQGVVAKLEGIHDFVMHRIEYVRDGHWDPAPAVLASGRGSCSEYTYVFIALCRAAGIPARYVGGITAKAGKALHIDLVAHRFPQAFIDGVGWVDFDPTRDRRMKDHHRYFGRTSGPMLLLCAGDGGRGSLTGWDYRSRLLWKGKTEKDDEDDDSPTAANYAATAVVQVGWWLPLPSAEVRRQVAAFRQRLAETPPAQRRPLIAEALKIDHPYVLPWLDDLLYDPATRVEAARAFLKIGGKDALLAVVDNLCRQNDREGDRQIGELLNAFSGEHFGGDRKKWKKWLNTRTPPAAIPTAGVPLRILSKEAVCCGVPR